MARIVPDSTEYETWENASDGQIWLKKFGRGGTLVDEAVHGRKKVLIRPEERRINQDMAADEELDLFRNGMLMPVKLVETTEDVEDLQASPNHLSEADMAKLLEDKRSTKVFAQRVSEIDNGLTLQRFMEVAAREETNASVRQMKILQERLTAVDRNPVQEVQSIAIDRGDQRVLRGPQAR